MWFSIQFGPPSWIYLFTMEDLEKPENVWKAKRKHIMNIKNDADKLLKSHNPNQEARLQHQLVTLQQRLKDISKVDEGILNKVKNEGEIEHKIIETVELKTLYSKQS